MKKTTLLLLAALSLTFSCEQDDDANQNIDPTQNTDTTENINNTPQTDIQKLANLTAGNEKTWITEKFFMNGVDVSDSIPCVKGIEVTFKASMNYESDSPCKEENTIGPFIIEDNLIIMNNEDTANIEVLNDNEFQYSIKQASTASFEGQDFAELEHTYTLYLTALD